MVTLDLGPGASASPAAQRPGEQRTTKVGEALEGRPARHAQLRSLLAELSQWEAVGEETSIALVRKQEKISELQATVGDRSQELQRLREELLLTQRQAEELTSAHNAAVAQAKVGLWLHAEQEAAYQHYCETCVSHTVLDMLSHSTAIRLQSHIHAATCFLCHRFAHAQHQGQQQIWTKNCTPAIPHIVSPNCTCL